MKKLVTLGVCLAAIAIAAPSAKACYDNTDKFITQLKKLDLTTEQLKDIFQFQKEHRALITTSHSEGKGCRVHEQHEVVFQTLAIGVLDDEQFQKQTGRERTELESLKYENYLLKKEIARLKMEIERLKATK